MMHYTIIEISMVIIIQNFKVRCVLEIKCHGQYKNVLTLKDPFIFHQMATKTKLHTLLRDTLSVVS